MRIVVIAGSQRTDSQTARIASYIADRLKTTHGAAAQMIDLAAHPLPFWQGDAGQDEPECWNAMSEALADCDALVLCSPEWDGMATPALKNMLLYCSEGQLAHKPALIVTVSSNCGGTYPLAELRMSGFKNNRICYIPEHIIVRDVENALRDDAASGPQNQALRGRIDRTLALLHAYALALRPVREAGHAFVRTYSYGM